MSSLCWGPRAVPSVPDGVWQGHMKEQSPPSTCSSHCFSCSPGCAWLPWLKMHVAGLCWASHPPTHPNPPTEGWSQIILCPETMCLCLKWPGLSAGHCAWPCVSTMRFWGAHLSRLSRSSRTASLPSGRHHSAWCNQQTCQTFPEKLWKYWSCWYHSYVTVYRLGVRYLTL